MFKLKALFAAAAVLALGVPTPPASTTGTWQIDARHSDAQLKTDATTEYGKTKIEVTLGFGRVRGSVSLDDADPTKDSVNLSMYPANGMAPAIAEDGKFLSDWLSNLSNHTLVCFHSKKVVRRQDGRLQATGDLVLTRVDRNVDATPSEAYAGPEYGPPMIHRVVREATFVFDIPADGTQKDGAILASGSTNVFHEDFPQLTKAVLTTYWPPVVQDRSCPAATVPSEDYQGSQCSGTMLMAPGLPEAPHAANAEDIGTPSNYNAVLGNHVNFLLHLRLTPKG